MPFLALVALGVVGGLLIATYMKPVADHLKVPQEHSAFNHLLHTVTEPRYLLSFVSVLFLATGGFMLMPFSSAFTVNNLGISLHDLPIIYLVTGIATIFVGPLVGKAADAFGKLRVFFFGTAVMIVMVLIYTHLERVDAARRDRDQRRAVRRNLLAHDSVPGADVAGAGADAARLVQRDQRVDFAAGGRAGVRSSRDTSCNKARTARSITTTSPVTSSSRRHCWRACCCGASIAESRRPRQCRHE